jgi:hypothetical protein
MSNELITGIFKRYLQKMTDLHLYHRAVKENSKRELEALAQYSQRLQERPELEQFPTTINNMFFISAKTGEPVFFGHKKSTLNDRINAVFFHKNKQYQWLLAEAYEQFEDAIEGAYAYLGYKDRNIWPLSDYGNVTLDELADKDFTWFLQLLKNKDIKKIINTLRNKYPQIMDIEENNKLNINLRFLLTTIKFIRHIIVHNGGRVGDKDKFIKEIFTESGFYNNGNYDQAKLDFLNSFFGAGDYSNLILLLEIPIDIGLPVDSHTDRLGGLFGCMMSYSQFVFMTLFYENNSA